MAKKILIIDDEIHVVQYLENIFQDNGYDTVSAMDGDQGFEKLKAEKPDLITLDLQMPQERGVKFYQRYRKDDEVNQIPIVVISGQSAPHRAIQPNKAAAIVPKPFEPAELVDIVQGIIGAP